MKNNEKNNSGAKFLSISHKSPISQVIDAANCILNDTSVPKLIYNEIKYHLRRINTQTKSCKNSIDELVELIKKCNIADYNDYLYGSGTHLTYYFSIIDEEYSFYKIVLPDKYNSIEKYNLILIITDSYLSSEPIQDDSDVCFSTIPDLQDSIIAYVGGRAYSIGGYMWEACLLNEINHIVNEYSIDKDRVFAMADDVGGIPLINFASKHPHLFAGILIKNTSMYSQSIKNLYNVTCLSVTSCENINNRFFNNCKLKYYLPLLQCIHVSEAKSPNKHITVCLDIIIKKMLASHRNKYPNTIYYRTENNRNRRAYYIEIMSITPGKRFASVQLQIKSNCLYIVTKNCTGIKIKTPPQLLNQNFKIIANGKELDFQHKTSSLITIKHSRKKGYEICNNFTEKICTYKGYGLLDVYNSPVHIICCDKKDLYLEKVSRTFSTPLQNKNGEASFFSYPIEKAEEFVINKKYSYVVIDKNVRLSKHLSKIHDLLPIKMDNDGFEYNNTRMVGTYCIMQVISNPTNENRTVLYINTNDSTSYIKNRYTRELIIPPAETGFHPMLNGVALVWINYKYYYVDEWGEKLKEM